MTKLLRVAAVGLLALAAACDDADTKTAAKSKADGVVTADSLPTPPDPFLARGKAVWAATCQPCHGTGLGGAPKIGNRELWAPRIAQGIDVLYGRALKGFTGHRGEMPARGGNENLSDDEVKAAVSFMVSQSQ